MREIDKVFLYNRVMSVMEKTLRDIFEQLNEEYGLHFYADKNFHNVANLIADTILYTFKEIDISGYNIAMYNDIDDVYIREDAPIQMRRVVFPTNLGWLDKIDLYVTKTILDNDSFVVCDDYVWGWDIDENGEYKEKPKRRSFSFVFKDTNNDIIRNPYMVSNGIIKRASIVFSLNSINKDELIPLIEHEIGHIYDMYANGLTATEMNTDLMNIPRLQISTNEKNIALLMNPTISQDEKKEIVRKMTVDEISDFFAETVYVFNRSEMRQRLNNFRYEMTKANLKYAKMRISNEPMEVILSSYSVIYADYLTYYKILGWFKESLDDSVKNEFANNDIKLIYAKKRDEPNVPKYAYGESFLDDSKYTHRSFDKFIEYHRRNIMDIFLHNATSMAVDIFDL